MIHLVEFFWNLSFSIASLLLQSLLALRKKAMSMAAVSSTSPSTPLASPPLPWKRFAEPPLPASKRSKESPVIGTPHRPRHADVDGGAFVPELHRPWRRELVLAPAPLPIWSRPPQDSASCHGDVDPGGHTRDREGDASCHGDADRGGYTREKYIKEEDTTQRRMTSVRIMAGMDLPAASAGDEGKAGRCPRVRRRPTRIVIPATDVVSAGFGEAGGVQTNGEFQAEGSCYCVAGRRGNRRVMEDGYGVITDIKGDAKQAYFGVFDGHGGRAAVDYVSEKLGENIIAALGELEAKGEEGDPETAVMEGYLTTDKEFLTKGVASGACAATVLLKDGELHAANVGDCRVVMSRKGAAAPLTADHRPHREDERSRIENSGGYVGCHHGVWRVQGSLAVSRAIGDLHVKDWIISEPETTRLRLTEDCEFLILASDGLWDKVSNEEAVDVVAKHKSNFAESCKKLIDLACSRGSQDDITIMVVDLRRFVQGGGQMAT